MVVAWTCPIAARSPNRGLAASPQGFQGFLVPKRVEVNAAGYNAVFHIVDGVGDIVGEVHDLGFHCGSIIGVPVAHPF